jgi:hypothetical protein
MLVPPARPALDGAYVEVVADADDPYRYVRPGVAVVGRRDADLLGFPEGLELLGRPVAHPAVPFRVDAQKAAALLLAQYDPLCIVPGSETGVDPADALVKQLLPAFGNMPTCDLSDT